MPPIAGVLFAGCFKLVSGSILFSDSHPKMTQQEGKERHDSAERLPHGKGLLPGCRISDGGYGGLSTKLVPLDPMLIPSGFGNLANSKLRCKVTCITK